MDMTHFIVIMIFNGAGEIALQQRAAADTRNPLHWDFSVGGHMEPDEDQYMAAARELREELGIEAQLLSHGVEYYNMRGVFHLFSCLHSGPFHIDPVEVCEMRFFSHGAIQDMMDRNDRITPPFRDFWKRKIIQSMYNSIKT